jgi:hypothetical protein
VVALAVTTADAMAKPGTFAGSLGVKVQKGAQAEIRAVKRTTGAVALARPVGRSGRFSLSLAPGQYLVVGTVVTQSGKLVQKRIGVSLKSGQKRKGSSLKARKKKKKRKRKRPRSNAAFVQERGQVTPGRIAVEIPDVTGSVGDPDWDVFKRGINDLMMNDVLNARDDCGTTLIEVDRRADLIKELEFQQSPYVDPSTRVRRNLIIGDVEIRGTIASAGGDRAKVTMRTFDKRSGRSLGSREIVLDKDNVFDQLETLAKRLADDLCKLSDVYRVTLDVAGEGRFATHTSRGAVQQVLLARRNGPGQKVWTDTGPLQWTGVTFASTTECTYVAPVIPAISWSVTIRDAGHGRLQVTWTRSGNDSTTASVDCPGDPFDPPPIPGQPGVALINTGPGSFQVPYAGGTQPLSGVVADGGDGFFNTGSITVRPAGVR